MKRTAPWAQALVLSLAVGWVGCSGNVSGGGKGGSSGTGRGGSGGSGGSMPVAGPAILSFRATPTSLPAGGGEVTLSWQVLNARSQRIDHDVGDVSGDSVTVTAAATTIYTLSATNDEGTSTATTAVVIGQNPSSHGGRYVAMASPAGGESFVAPASLRLTASARDPNISTNDPGPGLGGNAEKVQFFVDDDVVLEVDGGHAEYWMFQGFASGVAAGQHRVWARAIYVAPEEVLDSAPMIVTVDEPPAYARTVDLDADVTLSGGTGYELAGSADGRIRLNGNGHRIVSSGSASGPLTLRFVDVFDLGDRVETGGPAIDVTTSGTVTIEDCAFDGSNTLHVAQTGSGTASVRRNLLRSNMRMPIGQNPDSAIDHPSYPSASFGGTSTGAKVFASNNVGAGWVEFVGASNWTIGGDSDADSNVLIGPRVGIHVQKSAGMQVRRNYSHHVYFGGWSQGNNFELNESPTAIIEHNVVYGSSWPVRGVAGEFRYNLVLEAGHQWLWADSTGGYIHHNIFSGGEADIGGVYVLYNPANVRIANNTFDLQGSPNGTLMKMSDGTVSLTSNMFLNAPHSPAISIEGGTLSADYNLFSTSDTSHYSDGRKPAHDIGGATAVDPQLTDPPTVVFDLDEVGIWKRTTTVRDVLSRYRTRYTPKDGSTVIDAGDPAGGAGNDVGAVGAGTPNAADKFGVF